MTARGVRFALGAALGALLVLPAHAERADRDKPARIEADRMSADDAQRLTLFEGNVLLARGTLSIRAERIVVRQDAEGFQHATATGSPVRVRQRSDARDGAPGVWIEAEARRVEIDAREERIELFESARVSRGDDEMRGEYIVIDQRTESFAASGGKDGQSGRVQAVIQPKTPATTPRAQ